MKTEEGLTGETQPPALLSVNDKLPRLGQWVMVVTPWFHCLGSLGPHGEWRHTGDGSVIENVQSWYPIDADQKAAASWRATSFTRTR
jgi:hypothetical protein